jgi:parallel beta-helix repeat protein
MGKDRIVPQRIVAFLAIAFTILMIAPGAPIMVGGSGEVGDPPGIASGDPPARSGRTIIVDCNGTGDYTEINDACNAAVDGDTIRVYDGSYEGGSIYRSIKLIGNGTETILDYISIRHDDVNIRNIQISGTSWSSIYVYNRSFNIENVFFQESYHGIRLYESNGLITNCSFRNISTESISMGSSNNITFINNNFNNNIVKMNSNHQIKFIGNIFSNNSISLYLSGYDIYLKDNVFLNTSLDLDFARIEKTSLDTVMIDESNSINGIPFLSIDHGNNINIRTMQPVFLKSTKNINIDIPYVDQNIYPLFIINGTNINLKHGHYVNSSRIRIIESSNVIIEKNIFNDVPIYLKNISSLTLSNNTLDNHLSTLEILNTNNALIEYNKFNNKSCGIYVYQLSYLIMRYNEFSNPYYGIYSTGKSDHFIIENNSFKHVQTPTYFNRMDTISVNANSFSDFKEININTSPNLIFSKNTVNGIKPDSRIYLRGTNVIISNNSLKATTLYIVGMEYEMIADNVIRDSDYGIYLNSCDHLDITRNIIENNDVGLYMYFSDYSVIWNNSFIDNKQHFSSIVSVKNTFDRKYPIGGNYWSEYEGLDKYYGVYQNIDGSDGFGDLPFTYYDLVAKTNITDNYPKYRDVNDPIASANGDSTIDEGQKFIFDGSKSTDDNMVTKGKWSFKYHDENVELYGIKTEFLFDYPGFYTVSFTSYDYYGNHDDDKMTLNVRDIKPPLAVSQGDILAEKGTLIKFDGSGSNDTGIIETYLWKFDYGGKSVVLSGVTPEFFFDNVGVYTVTLIVYDSASHMNSTFFYVKIKDSTPPKANAGGDIFITNGWVCEFQDAGSSDDGFIINYTWSFLYGGIRAEIYGSHVIFRFDIPGYYVVTLTVKDDFGNAGEDQILVTVKDTIDPKAAISGDRLVKEGEYLSLSGVGSTDNGRILRYVWSFEDGSPVIVEGMDLRYDPERTGIRTITLTVYDEWNNSNSASVKVTIMDSSPPIADAGPDLTRPLGVEVYLNGSLSRDDGPFSQFVWTFEYGGSHKELVGVYTGFLFEIPGTYPINLTVTDWASNAGRDSMILTVVENGTVTGVLFSSNEHPVKGAVVDLFLNGIGFTTKTDDYGSFSIDVPAGEYTYRIYKPGYHDISGNVTVRAMESTVLDLPPMREAPNYTWIVIMAGLTVIASALAIAILVIARSRRPKMRAAPPIWAVKVQQQAKPSDKPIHKGIVRRPGIVLEKDNKKIPP